MKIERAVTKPITRFPQQEPKLLTEYTQDPVLLENYRTGKDIYSTLISTALGVPYETVTKQAHQEAVDAWKAGGKIGPEPINYRNQGKTLQLALSYGLGVDALGEKLKISRDEAEKLMNDFKENLSTVFNFEASLKSYVRQHGYLINAWGNKRRFPNYALPEIQIEPKPGVILTKPVIDDVTNSLKGVWKFVERRHIITQLEMKYPINVIDNFERRKEDSTQILNSLIQGSGATMIKVALVNIDKDERLKELGAELILTIHDEIIIQVDRENAQEAKEIMERLMTEAAEMVIKSIPFPTEGEVTDRWIPED